MHKALRLRDDLEYISRKEGGRGHASIKDYVNALLQGLEDYIEKRKERLITAANNRIGHISKVVKNDNNQEKEMGRKANVSIFQTTN